ncbi:MAG: GGDEF domain-containing protein [Myxococcales bacterium]
MLSFVQLPRLRRPLAYALVGLALSSGAPLGWLAFRALAGGLGKGPLPAAAVSEVAAQAELYAYLLASTAVAFSAFGAALGRLIEQRDAANRRLLVLAVTDAVTGLRNARDFHERLAQEWARAHRQRIPLSLIMADIDHFKEVNDRLGHAEGDRALAHVAAIIQGNVRLSDVACRIGGEEFGIICPDSGLAASRAVAERIRAALAGTSFSPARGGSESVTASFGVAEDGADADQLFRAADAALYVSKKAGRNRVTASS